MQWTASMEPGASPPIHVFTFLRYIPASFAYWKRRAIDAGKTMDESWSTARRLVKERRALGERRNCIIDGLLDEYEQKGWPASISQHAFTNLMGEIIEGGADTTAAQLLTLILAFALHPEVQRKAQAEIDEVCGSERSPRWDDFEKLPYINCIVKEGMRWRPVAVTVLPHKTRQNDEENGMFIPKDSTVFIATWALHHTDANYPNHGTFKARIMPGSTAHVATIRREHADAEGFLSHIAFAAGFGGIFEPIYDNALMLYFYGPGQWTAFTSMGVPQPVWVYSGYTLYGTVSVFLNRQIASGITRPLFFRYAVIELASSCLFEIVVINGGVYEYWGPHVLRIFKYLIVIGILETVQVMFYSVAGTGDDGNRDDDYDRDDDDDDKDNDDDDRDNDDDDRDNDDDRENDRRDSENQ
ncbi:cytochrome p450 [Colletotrichum camelliae]|nr:cytochrome p450 [Colletotrichum camelliae]